jgi:hypothetical protein
MSAARTRRSDGFVIGTAAHAVPGGCAVAQRVA